MRSPAGKQISSHDRILDISCLEQLDKAKMTFQKQTWCVSGTAAPPGLKAVLPGVFNLLRQDFGRGQKIIICAIKKMKVHNICFSCDAQFGVQS